MKKLLLLFVFNIFACAGFSQCYSVSQITYAPDSFNLGTPVIVQDDFFSGIIPLPFPFCYYGVSDSQIVIGSNGMISFNTSQYANGICPFFINAAIPSSNDPLNAIFFPWQDVAIDTVPDIFYATYGTTP